MCRSLILLGTLVVSVPPSVAATPDLMQSERILFLGDSITHAGHFISLIETHLRLQKPQTMPEMINLGLPSETCCGLSEPDHPFPRPDVHERLDRALNTIQPDLVFPCYGMNDGIYYPFSTERFEAYQNGINTLITKVKASGAKLILMTPPAFDPLPLRTEGKLRPAGSDSYAWFAIYENYDAEVLQPYAAWIMQQHHRVDAVIDLHTPVTDYVMNKRKSNALFTMSPDGVHVNNEGHSVLAAAICRSLFDTGLMTDRAVLQLVSERQGIMHAAWVSHVGHKRPGVQSGLPLDEAIQKTRAVEEQLKRLATRTK